MKELDRDNHRDQNNRNGASLFAKALPFLWAVGGGVLGGGASIGGSYAIYDSRLTRLEVTVTATERRVVDRDQVIQIMQANSPYSQERGVLLGFKEQMDHDMRNVTVQLTSLVAQVAELKTELRLLNAQNKNENKNEKG